MKFDKALNEINEYCGTEISLYQFYQWLILNNFIVQEEYGLRANMLAERKGYIRTEQVSTDWLLGKTKKPMSKNTPKKYREDYPFITKEGLKHMKELMSTCRFQLRKRIR